MMQNGDDKLRHSLTRSGAGRSGGDDCPGDDAIWAAAHGELPPEQAQPLIDHAVECAACGVSFRMAAGIEAEQDRAAAAETKTARFPRRRWLPLGVAAAAVLIVVVLVPRGPGELSRGDDFRGGGEAGIESLVDAARPLPRDDFLLRWSPGPAGTLYTLTVTTEDLTVLHTVEEIEFNEHALPTATLAGLPSGSVVVWRVRATLPDARQVDSPVFRATVD